MGETTKRDNAEREKAMPQNLWGFAIEELDRALGNLTFRQTFLDNPRADKIDAFRTALRRDWSKRVVKGPPVLGVDSRRAVMDFDDNRHSKTRGE